MRTTGTILTAGPWLPGQHLMQEDGQFKFYVQIYPLKFQQECLVGLRENCHVSGTFGVGEKLTKSLLFWGL